MICYFENLPQILSKSFMMSLPYLIHSSILIYTAQIFTTISNLVSLETSNLFDMTISKHLGPEVLVESLPNPIQAN